MERLRFKERFAARVLTRFHMALILLGTALSGVILSKLLLIAGLHLIVVRFVVVLPLAYLCFLLLMKLWLVYLTAPYRNEEIARDLIDAADVGVNQADSHPADPGALTPGHGGGFGPGGASGSWAPGPGSSAVAASDSGSVATGSAGATGDGDGDFGLAAEGALVLIPFGSLLIAIFGGGLISHIRSAGNYL